MKSFFTIALTAVFALSILGCEKGDQKRKNNRRRGSRSIATQVEAALVSQGFTINSGN